MHISSLYLSTYDDAVMISGQLKITHEGTELSIALSEADRQKIQDICVNAYLTDRQRVVDALMANTPAMPMLSPPEPEPEYTAFEPVEEPMNYGSVAADPDDIPF